MYTLDSPNDIMFCRFFLSCSRSSQAHFTLYISFFFLHLLCNRFFGFNPFERIEDIKTAGKLNRLVAIQMCTDIHWVILKEYYELTAQKKKKKAGNFLNLCWKHEMKNGYSWIGTVNEFVMFACSCYFELFFLTWRRTIPFTAVTVYQAMYTNIDSLRVCI